MVRFWIKCVLALGLAGVLFTAGLQAQTSISEQYLLSAVNAERTQRGLSVLHWDAHLYQAARLHCLEMVSHQAISHQFPGEIELSERGKRAGVRFSQIAENVAEAPTSVRIHDAWMNSPGHRENILDPNVDSIGISVMSRNGQLYAVQDFSRTVAALTLDEQEAKVATLLNTIKPLNILPASDDWRRTCQMETGYAGAQRPWFVMRFTAGDLTRLPNQLNTQLATGKYHRAAVGACTTKRKPALHVVQHRNPAIPPR